MRPDDRQLDQIKGFLDPIEGQKLYTLALEASLLGPCLEIGSYCGKSAVYLGSACKVNGSVLFSVDHHRGSEEQQPGEAYFDPQLFDTDTFAVDTLPWLRRTLQQFGLENTVAPLICSSMLAARQWATPLSLVFIDGGHAYSTVLADYQAWARHVKPGGYLVFHDIYVNPEQGGQAPRQVYEQAAATEQFEAQPMVQTLGVLRRVARPGRRGQSLSRKQQVLDFKLKEEKGGSANGP